jgi:LysR family hydrogen peroxide-inducible transcriptional activator
MDLRQLDMLVAIADHGSFSAAARSLHTVQSNVSTHIARLEREVGATCIDRSTGQLTDEGQAVVDRARRIQSEIDDLRSDVASLRDQITGRVRMGIIGTVARWAVSPLLQALADTHPGIDLVVLDATTTSLVPQLVSGALDLAVVNLPADHPDITFDPLFDEEAVLIAPEGHPLHDRERVSLPDLSGVPLLLPAPGTSFRDDLDAAAAEQQVELTARAEIDGMRLLASLTFSGFGAAIVPATAAPGWIGGSWRRIPVDGGVHRVVGIARRKRGMLSTPGRAVLEVLVDVLRAHASEQESVLLT